MTLPIQEKYAVDHAERFLLRLLRPSETPRIPKAIRKEARDILKHFPNGWRRDQIWGDE